jgi:hypothetical protein
MEHIELDVDKVVEKISIDLKQKLITFQGITTYQCLYSAMKEIWRCTEPYWKYPFPIQLILPWHKLDTLDSWVVSAELVIFPIRMYGVQFGTDSTMLELVEAYENELKGER